MRFCVYLCSLLIHYKPTHLNFKGHEKCWAVSLGALGTQIKPTFKTWQVGEGQVPDERLLLMKRQWVQSLGRSLGGDERSPAQLAKGTPLESICQTITLQQLLWEWTHNSHLPFLAVMGFARPWPHDLGDTRVVLASPFSSVGSHRHQPVPHRRRFNPRVSWRCQLWRETKQLVRTSFLTFRFLK